MFSIPPLKWPISPARAFNTNASAARTAARLNGLKTARFMIPVCCGLLVPLWSLLVVAAESLVGGHDWVSGDGAGFLLFHPGAFLARQCRVGVLLDKTAHINESKWLGGFLGQSFQALLHGEDFVWMRSGEVILLVGIFCKVKEFEVGRKDASPDEFPIALAETGAERLDVIDNLGTRRRFGFADSAPNIQPIERFTLCGR